MKEQEQEVFSKVKEFQMEYGYRCPDVLSKVLGRLQPYMKGFDPVGYMGDRDFGFDGESIKMIYAYVGEDGKENTNDAIFYELPFDGNTKYKLIPSQMSSGTSNNQAEWSNNFVKVKEGSEKQKTNYLISKSQWSEISKFINTNDIKSAVDLMMECMNVKFIKEEKTKDLQEAYQAVLYKGSYLGFLWDIHPFGRSRMQKENQKLLSKIKSADKNGGIGYFIVGIDDQKIPEKTEYTIDSGNMKWKELKDVYRYLQDKNMLPSFDIAIKTDNYIRRHINTFGNIKLGYRDQTGHRWAYDPDDFGAIFVFGDDIPSEETNSDCKKYQNWEETEEEIIDVLYTNNKKDIYDIQNMVKEWFGK